MGTGLRTRSGQGQDVFAKLLKLKLKGGFSWDADGGQLLRRHKSAYFDGTRLPRTVTLSRLLSDALQQSV
jgi:hypothetical protein